MAIEMFQSMPDPSYAQGYARCASDALSPGMWSGLRFAGMAPLGATGGTLYDISGYGNHGTLTSMDPATDWPVDEMGTVLDFDSSSDWVTCGSNVIDTPNTFTCFCLVKINRDQDNQYLLDTSDGATGFGLRTGVPQTMEVFVFRDGLSHVADSGTYTLGQWTSVVGRMTPTHVELWIDGQFVASNSSNTGAMTAGGNLGIGATFGGGTQRLLGQIAVVALWSRALSPSEIMHLYADPLALVRQRGMVVGSVAAAAGFVPYPYPLHEMTGGLVA